MVSTYRIAVMADIHGNLPAFQAVMADLERHAPLDAILVAGDIICGPGQSTILHRLIEMGAVMIQGNNEKAVMKIASGNAPDYVYTTKQYNLRRWACQNLTSDEIAFISGLPEQWVVELPNAHAIRMVHGSPRDINELVVPVGYEEQLARTIVLQTTGTKPGQAEEMLQLVDEPVVIFGHTHLPWEKHIDGRLAFNPGAVNYPSNGFVGAQYALLSWDGRRWTTEFYAIPYNLEALRRSNEESGFLQTGLLAKVFLQELVSGKDIASDLFVLANHLMKEAGLDDLPYIPDEIWEKAEKKFENDMV